MKTVISLLIAVLFCSSVFSYPITATIIFENHTDNTSISGMFYIAETNQSLEINSLDRFSIELPKKGKYHFSFHSEDVNAFITYPVRMTKRKNTITIRLESKITDYQTSTALVSFRKKDISNFSIEQIEEGLENGIINFIVHGLVVLNPNTVKAFKRKYGVGFISENCVVDPISFRVAMDNNKKIADYLTSKFGDDWKNELPTQPFGLPL